MEAFLQNIPQHLQVYCSLSVTELITRIKDGKGLYYARLSRSDTVHLKQILTFLISEEPTRTVFCGIELEQTQTEIQKKRKDEEIEMWIKEREKLWEQQRQTMENQRQEDARREKERQRLEEQHRESMSRHSDKTNHSTKSMDTDLSTIDQLQEEEPIW